MHELHVKVLNSHEGVRTKIEDGFLRRDADAESLAIALVALYDGLAVNRMLGVSDAANKRAWVAMLRA